MIYSLRGKLIFSDFSTAVIECAGVGYKCLVTANTAKQLPHIGEEAMLFTVMSVKEDSVTLIGFASKPERDCFTLLTSVSGVGAKVAVAILSELSSEQVAMAIVSSDDKTLSRASGVGKKLAQRIILELKDKMTKGFAEAPSVAQNTTAAFDSGNIPKAIAALSVLGYSAADVTPVLSKLDGSLSVEELIRLTLVEFGKK